MKLHFNAARKDEIERVKDDGKNVVMLTGDQFENGREIGVVILSAIEGLELFVDIETSGLGIVITFHKD